MTDASLAADRIEACFGPQSLIRGPTLAVRDPGGHPDNLAAGILALPSTTAEVAEIVRICAEHGVGLVPQGGRTGLVGGAISAPGEIALSLERMNAILSIDAQERVAVVEAGATLQSLIDAAEPFGLEPGIDLPSRGSATLGGMASTNAGGIMAFRNGVMRHQVLGLEAVLPDGSPYRDLTRVVKVAAGYDLKQLFIGAEGTLGVITGLAMKLEPKPAASATALFSLPAFGAALDAIDLGLRTGVLRAAEILGRRFLQLNAEAQEFHDAAIDVTQPLFLLLALGGAEAAPLREALETLFATLAERYPEAGGVTAASERQARELWRLREDTHTVYRAFPAAPSYDVSVPISAIEDYVRRVESETAALGFAPFLFGHLADGNLHIIFNHAGPFAPDTSARVEEILYRSLRALGGSFSAEHGVGSKRIGALNATADPGKLALMATVKRALDPNGLINPGKLFALP